MRTLRSKARSRPASSSMPISSPRRASRGGSAIGSRSRPAPSRPISIATRWRRSSGIAPESVRIIPTAVGGGFGSKLDLSVQPFIGVAAWVLNRPVRMVYSRSESMMSTTKRHPSQIQMKVGACKDGLIARDRAPRRFQHRRLCLLGADGRQPRAGAWLRSVFRAELPRRPPAPSTPIWCRPAPSAASACRRAAVAQEQLYDELAEKLGLDPLEFRLRNALTRGPADGLRPGAGRGLGLSRACLEALAPHWQRARAEAEAFNTARGRPLSPRRRRRRHVVWLRQHFAGQSLDHPHRA